ncbi:hypothetical protein ACFCZ3_19825 [Cellulosimicrobium cellulans]|uniref:hypothetical protein n=1 Tax=Cellulosimicrobium cellulans TaxID=1710 RepID=UPI0035DBD0DA
MTSLPTGITYGTVKGRFVEAILDGPDEDDNPDARPIVGTVTLTPEAKHILAATNVPPTTVMATALKIPLDSSGSFETKVVATDNTALNPAEWTYRVTFSFDRGITYTPFNIEVPAGQITDLTVTAPSPVSPGVVTVVREEDRVAAEAAALRAEDAARRAEEAANGGGGSGDPGPAGKSAYEVAVDEGFVGDVVAWLASLVGPKGDPGATTIDGIEGLREELDAKAASTAVEPKRDPGTSSGERAVGYANGEPTVFTVHTSPNTSTIAKRGAGGVLQVGDPTAELHAANKRYVDAAIADVGGGAAPVTKVNDQTGDVVLDASDVGAIPDTYAEPDGETRVPYYSANTGQQAHIIMTVNPDSGTLVKRQASGHVLVPNDPDFGTHAANKNYVDAQIEAVELTPGASAYEVAVAAGFVGDQAAWLASLKGAKGDAGADGVGALVITDGSEVPPGTPACFVIRPTA